jgi:hypothetical protein
MRVRREEEEGGRKEEGGGGRRGREGERGWKEGDSPTSSIISAFINFNLFLSPPENMTSWVYWLREEGGKEGGGRRRGRRGRRERRQYQGSNSPTRSIISAFINFNLFLSPPESMASWVYWLIFTWRSQSCHSSLHLGGVRERGGDGREREGRRERGEGREREGKGRKEMKERGGRREGRGKGEGGEGKER